MIHLAQRRHATALTKIRRIRLRSPQLSLQALSAESIPPEGCRVILRNNANLSTGGSATDVTDDVHTEAVRCAWRPLK
jgi:cyanophycin synthetase